MLPDDVSTIIALAQSLTATGQLDEAQQLLRQAIKRAPQEARLRVALGRMLLEDQCLDDAERCFRESVDLHPTLSEAHYGLARVFVEHRQIESAIAADRQALQYSPQFMPALLHLASLLQQQQAPAEAEVLYRRALELQPESSAIRHGLAVALATQGHCEEALVQYDSALQLNPDNAAIHIDRAKILLQAARFAEGWEEYKWRWTNGQQARYSTRFAQPSWDGSSLAQRTILLCGEQGLAQEIMFATCYPDIIRAAGQCVIVCDARLERLFHRSFPDAVVLGVPQGSERAWRQPSQLSIDVQCSAGSLPKFLRRSEEAFPRQPRLLTADPQRVADWQKQLANWKHGLKIGISWRNRGQPTDSTRRHAPLAQWQTLLSTPGIQWFNLESGDYHQELAETSRKKA